MKDSYKLVLINGQVLYAEQNLADILNGMLNSIQKFRNCIDNEGKKHAFLYIPIRNILFAYREK